MFDSHYTTFPETKIKEEKQNVEVKSKPVEDVPRPADIDVSIGKLRDSTGA